MSPSGIPKNDAGTDLRDGGFGDITCFSLVAFEEAKSE
jgi:hypothetical protein